MVILGFPFRENSYLDYENSDFDEMDPPVNENTAELLLQFKMVNL